MRSIETAVKTKQDRPTSLLMGDQETVTGVSSHPGNIQQLRLKNQHGFFIIKEIVNMKNVQNFE